MLKTYPDILRDEKNWGKYFCSASDPDLIDGENYNLRRNGKGGNIRGAVNYALASKGSFDVSLSDVKDKLTRKIGLESLLSLIFIFAGIFLIGVQHFGITGNAVQEWNLFNEFFSFGTIGVLLFLLGVFGFLVRRWL